MMEKWHKLLDFDHDIRLKLDQMIQQEGLRKVLRRAEEATLPLPVEVLEKLKAIQVIIRRWEGNHR